MPTSTVLLHDLDEVEKLASTPSDLAMSNAERRDGPPSGYACLRHWGLLAIEQAWVRRPVEKWEKAQRVGSAVPHGSRQEQLVVDAAVRQQQHQSPGGHHALDDPTLPPSSGAITLTSMVEVKKRRRGTSKISSKHQITIPAEALRSAGLEIGDRLVARSDGAGRVILEREHDVVAELAGALTGVYQQGELDEFRSEWD